MERSVAITAKQDDATFDESGDMMALRQSPEDYANIPGWVALDHFLRHDRGITSERGINAMRTLYNHYMKRFPVHYFTQDSVPEIVFALFFPVKWKKQGVNESHYLIVLSQEDRQIKLYHKNIWSNLKTRRNFFRQTKRWIGNESLSRNEAVDIGEILELFEEPQKLLALRAERFSGFLERAQNKLRRMGLDRSFKGHWPKIRSFLEERDRLYLTGLINIMKSRHVSVEAAKRSASISNKNLHLYNWMVAGTDEKTVRNRTQLGEIYPWLAQALTDEACKAHYGEIQRVVDCGEPLIPALEDFLNAQSEGPIRQSTIRKTVSWRLEASLLPPHRLSSLLCVMDSCYAHARPDEDFLGRLNTFMNGSQNVFSYLNSSVSDVLARAPVEIRDAIVTGDPAAVRRRAMDYSDTRDYMERIYTQLVLPYFVYRAHRAGQAGLPTMVQNHLRDRIWTKSYTQRLEDQDIQPPYLRPYGNMELHNIVKLSMHWHEHIGRATVRFNNTSVDDSVSWPTLTADRIVHGDITIRPLCSKKDLQREQREMGGSCIGYYAPNCLGMDRPGDIPSFSHIFSLVAEGEKNRITAELLEEKNQKGERRIVRIGGMDGKRVLKNTWNPPAEGSQIRNAVEWLVEKINSGALKVDWERVDRQRSLMNIGQNLSSISKNEIGYDATNPRHLISAFYSLRPFLPERYRKCTYDQWIKKMGFHLEADTFFAKPGQDLSSLNFNKLEVALGRLGL